MWKKVIAVGIITLNLFLLTGCWNKIEIDEQLNVAGVAIDVGENGKSFHISAEAVTTKTQEKSAIDTKVIEADGNTIFEAFRGMVDIASKKLYFGNCKVVIVSEALARKGISQLIDIVTRNHETRSNMDIVISEGCSAKDVLLTEAVASPIVSYEIHELLRATEKNAGKAALSESYQVSNSIQTAGVSTVIPVLQLCKVEDSKTFKFSGVGVFNKDKLVGFLTPHETKILSFINNKIKNGLLTIEAFNGSHSYVSFEISGSKSQKKYQEINNTLKVDVITETKVLIGEVGPKTDFIKAGRETIKLQLEEKMEEDFYLLINKAQTELKSDIFGIGLYIYKNSPELWEKYSVNWDETFKTLEIVVDCKVEILGSGMNQDTIKLR